MNGIEYEYEKLYFFSNIMYCFDFYLIDYDIYLEYFGVDENNGVKWFMLFNEKKYVEEIKLKREIYKINNIKFLEMYLYYNCNNVLFDKLKEMLKNENVVFKLRDIESIYIKVIDNDKNFGKEIIKFIEIFINFSKLR